MISVVSLVLGLVIGYLGQRSRLCFIAGYRNFFMARDTSLLKGIVGAFFGAAGVFVLARWLGGDVPGFPMLLYTHGVTATSAWVLTIVGGLGVGVVGVFSGGCPFRMHVLASEGKRTYWAYLLGFYVGLVFFNLVTAPTIQLVAEPATECHLSAPATLRDGVHVAIARMSDGEQQQGVGLDLP